MEWGESFFQFDVASLNNYMIIFSLYNGSSKLYPSNITFGPFYYQRELELIAVF